MNHDRAVANVAWLGIGNRCANLPFAIHTVCSCSRLALPHPLLITLLSNMSASKDQTPGILMLGVVIHAHAEFEELGKIGQVQVRRFEQTNALSQN